MEFRIIGVKDSVVRDFYYDNELNTLRDEDKNLFEFPKEERTESFSKVHEIKVFDKNRPLVKSKFIKILKIQLGLTCNYSCTYCSQRFVERPEENTKHDIDMFMQKLENIEFSEEEGLRIELWGGEPFVYWKIMKPLTKKLKQKFSSWEKKPTYQVITNGSVLTDEIIDWIDENLTSLAVSHDGPGQFVRGPDPFDDPEKSRLLKKLYERMKGRMSFNTMMNASNMSRKKVFDWFCEKLETDYVEIGEGGIVDAYDEGGLELSLNTKEQHFKYRKTCVEDIIETEGEKTFQGTINMIDNFTHSILDHEANHISTVTQKCGMDDERTIAVDLKGNVITCQNVSAVDINSNGESHLGGNLDNIEDIKITTSTHWTQREKCQTCPVIRLCRGSCMFAQGEYFDQSCNNAYSDHIVKFALSLFKITDHMPIYIDNIELPPERRDIWGDQLKHTEDKKPKKMIPISVVQE